MHDSARGAGTGAVAGLLVGAVGEAATWLVSRLFPTDVLIAGFALIWAVPLGAAVGALCGWRGWLPDRYRRGAVAAIPGLLAGVAQALMQWTAT